MNEFKPPVEPTGVLTGQESSGMRAGLRRATGQLATRLIQARCECLDSQRHPISPTGRRALRRGRDGVWEARRSRLLRLLLRLRDTSLPKLRRLSDRPRDDGGGLAFVTSSHQRPE
ncbi:hypothetical protein DPEC_G00160490 [Dallia pectoralis]|uniref:Uncharacterized protein n=1 Tax=Dallia pectoralis TaxID=75939 RepID=A0ACC2GG78_DALPE|nr:hypothetical protein DPEC_G00160490 [Dallia pectoralis]